MDFLIATHNQKKKLELQRILKPLRIDVKTADELDIALTDVEETGITFEENAALKARFGCQESGIPTIADDSGLMVDALGGRPGVYSARYAGEHGNDGKNIEKLLSELEGVKAQDRTARFVSCVCCVFPDGRELTVRGECEGLIAFEPKGSGGFGYDPVFTVDGVSFAMLSPEQKDRLSHRGKALKLLSERLPEYI